MSGRVLFHVQHLLGIGHLKRAAILASAMAAAGLDVTVALGGKPVADVPFAGASISELPPAAIAGEDFSALLDEAGAPVDESWKAWRRDALLDLWRALDPDVLLIELYPFGRRQFAFELAPLLEAARSAPRPPAIVTSVRDILVTSKRPGRDAESVATLRSSFDAVLVHGDPALIPFGETFAPAPEIADLIRYTGYVSEPHGGASAEGHGEVIVSAGGGAVGAPLLLAAVAARPLTPVAGRLWRYLAGPNLPKDAFRRLQAEAGANSVVERFRADFAARLPNAALSISQAGYNTTMDILRAGVPAVVVPYETPGETEQRRRAELLAGKRILAVLPADRLSPSALAASIAAALSGPRPGAPGIDLSGAATTARIVAELAGLRRRRA